MALDDEEEEEDEDEAEDYAAARKKALESLMAAATDRSQRDGDVVISLGGQLGLGWGGRYGVRRDAPDDPVNPTPVHLALGVGLDWYPGPSPWGLHAMASVADLSQYVSFADKDLHVAAPDAKAALALGVTLGVRFALKQTPAFVGLNATYAPFVPVGAAADPAAASTGSYQVMGLVGLYVPLFDFN